MSACIDCNATNDRKDRHGRCRICRKALTLTNSEYLRVFIEDAKSIGWEALALLDNPGKLRPKTTPAGEVILGGGCVLVMETGYVIHRYVMDEEHGETYPNVGVTQDRDCAVRMLAKLAE